MKRIFLITLIAVTFFPGCQNKLVSIDAAPNTKSSTSIVSRAHWITVHVRNDETFTMLYEFFKDELQLPVFFHPEKWGGTDIRLFWPAMLFWKYAAHIQKRQFRELSLSRDAILLFLDHLNGRRQVLMNWQNAESIMRAHQNPIYRV